MRNNFWLFLDGFLGSVFVYTKNTFLHNLLNLKHLSLYVTCYVTREKLLRTTCVTMWGVYVILPHVTNGCVSFKNRDGLSSQPFQP